MNFKDFFTRDLFATGVGIELETLEKGSARASLSIKKQHLNAGGIAQGGVLFTLADLAMAAAANSFGKPAFSIQADIRFLRPAKVNDRLTATAVAVLSHKRISHLKAEIVNQEGELIAVADSICNVKPEINNGLEL